MNGKQENTGFENSVRFLKFGFGLTPVFFTFELSLNSGKLLVLLIKSEETGRDITSKIFKLGLYNSNKEDNVHNRELFSSG